MKTWATPLFVVLVALQGSRVQGQQRGGTPQTDTIQPINSGANPYRVVRDWAQLNIRIGSLKDGKVSTFIPPHVTPTAPEGAMGEGIAVDAAGNVYTAEAQLRGVTKYLRK
jgi:hypothetical protein